MASSSSTTSHGANDMSRYIPTFAIGACVEVTLPNGSTWFPAKVTGYSQDHNRHLTSIDVKIREGFQVVAGCSHVTVDFEAERPGRIRRSRWLRRISRGRTYYVSIPLDIHTAKDSQR